jgi:hypothetical protein
LVWSGLRGLYLLSVETVATSPFESRIAELGAAFPAFRSALLAAISSKGLIAETVATCFGRGRATAVNRQQLG